MMKLITHFPNFANAPKHYIFILMINFTINDSLEIWSSFKKLKITSVWKHEYSVVINGCPEARTKASFSAMVQVTLQQSMTCDFFTTFMAKRWSDSFEAFFFTSITFPNWPTPKIPIGSKLSIETFGEVSIWPETQSFNVLLRHRILYRIYRCYNYNKIIRCFCCWWWWWWLWWWWRWRQRQ